jgi:hypothetical protein
LDPIVINAQLTLDDWRALQAAATARLARSETVGRQWLRIVGLIGVAAAVFVAMTFFGSLAGAVHLPSLALGVLLVFVATAVNWRIANKRMAPLPGGTFLGSCTYTVSEDGLRATRSGSHSFTSWPSVVEITRADAHLFVWIDRLSAYVVPARALPETVTPEALIEWIEAARARARASMAPAEAQSPPAAPTAAPPAPRDGLRVRLADLANLIALRGKPLLTAKSNGVAATLATVLALSTWVAFNRSEYGPDPQFSLYGVAGVAWYVLGGLVVAWVLARASVPRIALDRAVAVSAVGAWLLILYTYLTALVGIGRWAAGCLVALGVLYALSFFGQATRALTGRVQPRATLAASGAAALFLWLSGALYVYAAVWVPKEEASVYEEWQRSVEQIEPLLFAQRERVDAALRAVPVNDPAETELYFVGFAGYGGQRVFAEEIKLADRAVEQRFASRAGSLLLLNDERDLAGAPLATESTLRYALRGVAEKMARDDDVLFLALSSHGSSDWELSVSNAALPLTSLSAADLAAALDEAGIKWRVIVISACYAGGFIEALEDPYTIVLAAAAPDRTSFGCSDERDLTYFGEAFYRDALPAAASLRDAFDEAERLIAEREAAEFVDRSRPTAFFGAEIERKLSALE